MRFLIFLAALALLPSALFGFLMALTLVLILMERL